MCVSFRAAVCMIMKDLSVCLTGWIHCEQCWNSHNVSHKFKLRWQSGHPRDSEI